MRVDLVFPVLLPINGIDNRATCLTETCTCKDDT